MDISVQIISKGEEEEREGGRYIESDNWQCLPLFIDSSSLQFIIIFLLGLILLRSLQALICTYSYIFDIRYVRV